jgi:hypothetical protein
MPKSNTEFRLVVVYPAKYYPALDQKLERAVKGCCAGSGYGFGERDMDWYFRTRRGAEGAESRINRLQLPKGVRTYIEESEV